MTMSDSAPQQPESLPMPQLSRQPSPNNQSAPCKLRDSCNGCASSKLKCTKEKPTCARCSRRGIVCEYTASKRSGRTSHFASISNVQPDRSPRMGNNQTNNTNRTRQESYRSPPVSRTSLLIPPLPSGPSSTTCFSSEQHSLHPSQDLWSSVLSPPASTGSDNGFSSLMPMGNDFNQMFSPGLLSTPDCEVPPGQQSSSNDCMPVDNLGDFLSDRDQFLSNDCSAGLSSSISDFNSILDSSDMEEPPPLHQTTLSVTPPVSNSNEMSSSEHGLFWNQELSASGMPGFEAVSSKQHSGCLTIALEFLMGLFVTAPTACMQPGMQSRTSKPPTIESVISKNKETIEAISNMMDCPCTQDDYIVTVLSLIVLKVMAWYSAAASVKSTPDDAMSWSDPFNDHLKRERQSSFGEQVLHQPQTTEDNDYSRKAAQLVLSELHRVQRLINLLSKRLEVIRLRNGDSSNSSSGSKASSVSGSSDPTSLPKRASTLSGSTFSQLETDLRKRLRSVSSDTLDILRQE